MLADLARDDRCGVGDEFAHAGNPLEDHRGEFFALAGAGRHHLVDRRAGNFKQRRLHLIESEAVIGEHARPAQQLRD